MFSLLIVVIQIMLAFFIVSTIYLVAIFYLKLSPEQSEPGANINQPKNHHLAVVFNDYINEDNLLEQIQYLNNQPYANFTAYFFIDEPYVSENNIGHIKIIRPLQKRPGKFGLLHLSKSYFCKTPDAILVMNPSAKIRPDYLLEMNKYLCDGYRIIQSEVSLKNKIGKLEDNLANEESFIGWRQRKIELKNLFSSAFFNNGFVIDGALFEKLNFNTYINPDKYLHAELIQGSAKIAYVNKARFTESAFSSNVMLEKKQPWHEQYLFGYHLGLNLLLEEVKQAGFEKIKFGYNFMRLPLISMIAASLLITAVDIIWMPSAVFLFWLSVLAFTSGVLLLVKPNAPLMIAAYTKQILKIISGEEQKPTTIKRMPDLHLQH